METGVVEEGPTRQTRRPRRERTKTTNAPEQERIMYHGESADEQPPRTPGQKGREARDQDDNNASETEDTIHVAAMAPGTPRRDRTATNHRLEDQMVPTRNHAPGARMVERWSTTAAASTKSTTESANTAANLQIKVLTDLVTSLLRMMEEQKEAQANQVEVLTKKLTLQIDTLKAEVTEMRRWYRPSYPTFKHHEAQLRRTLRLPVRHRAVYQATYGPFLR